MAHLPPPLDHARHHQQRQTPLVSPASSHRPPPPARLPPHMNQTLQRLAQANEETWILIGNLAEQMNDPDRAESAYEHALRHNPDSERALTQVASIARSRDDFAKAIEFFQRALDVRQENGEVWSALGHCYLMQDDLQKAYAAYQQALYHLPNPKDPKLWYGIGILYDRYGSLDNAEEAFASVLRMDANFEKAEEILFRLGIIYKQQQKYAESLECFDRILRNPPAPLANLDIWFQIGHVYEQAKNYEQAKEAYERVLTDSPNHAKVLQQLGWLYHQSGSSFTNQDMAIQCLTKSLEADSGDAQSWYLLGRAYMAVQKFQKAYEAYQQAVYRDGRNPTFWCSIGVLYYNINQYRDALDAYSRAIRINPYIPEVWFDLGSLYESCNNQISDAIDAYARAADLDPSNQVIKSRLRLLRDVQANGGTMPAAPGPQDVHPTAYATGHGPPSSMIMNHGPHTPVAPHHSTPAGGASASGAPPHPPSHHHRASAGGNHSRSNSRAGPANGIGPDHPINGGSGRDLPAPSPSMRGGRGSADTYRHPPEGSEPFRGGPPPPLNIDDSVVRRGSGPHGQLAPMELERSHGSHYPEPPRAGNGPAGPPAPPLHHPVPQPPIQSITEMPSDRRDVPSLPSLNRGPYDAPPHDGPRRPSSPAESPRGAPIRRPNNSAPSPAPPFHPNTPYNRSNYPPPTPQGLPPPITSAHHGLPYDRGTATTSALPERNENLWERRHSRNDSRNTMPGDPPSQPGFRSPAPATNGSAGPPPPTGSNYGPPPSHHGRPPSAPGNYDRPMSSPNVPRGGLDASDRRGARSPYQGTGPSGYQSYWSSQPPPGHHHSSPPRQPRSPPPAGPPKRYDPRFDEPPRREGPPSWERDAHQPDTSLPPPLQPQPIHPAERPNGPTAPALTPASTGGTAPIPPSIGDQKWKEPEPRWRRDSQSPRPGSTRGTAEPPKERKRRGVKTEKEDGTSTPKPGREKKERKPPAKRGGKQSQAEKEEERSSVPPAPPSASPSMTSQAPPFRAPSNHKSPPTQWNHGNSVPPGPTAAPPHIRRVSRSVDEDYDEEMPENEREDGHDSAAVALMGLAGYRTDKNPLPPPPIAQRTSSGGRLESLLNAPTRPPLERTRSPPGRTTTPLKRVASDEHNEGGDRKRSRIESNGASSTTASPPGPSQLSAILSPSTGRGNGTTLPPPAQSRRTSLDTRSDSQGRRSWAEGVENERKVSSTSPQNKVSVSPHALPPIATLTPEPRSPTVGKGGHLDGPPPRVTSPTTTGKRSPVAETA
ncbi:glucose repression mediator protein [Tulasnella sp. 403]|nr:glucose repression mediator protein [Tulasnella sp. 403]